MSEMEPVKFAEHLLISEVASRWLPKKGRLNSDKKKKWCTVQFDMKVHVRWVPNTCRLLSDKIK